MVSFDMQKDLGRNLQLGPVLVVDYCCSAMLVLVE
jgi:hypothetical protein